jgi:hypothetical protein
MWKSLSSAAVDRDYWFLLSLTYFILFLVAGKKQRGPSSHIPFVQANMAERPALLN